MIVSKSARYALHAALEMALSGEEPVTVVSVSRRYGIPQTALAKVFQQLVRAGLATGTRGIGGGYRLARRATHVSVLDVIHVFEPPHAAKGCMLSPLGKESCPPGKGCGLGSLFDEADELLRCTFASVSLATLARRKAGKPVPLERRPPTRT
jgi:Rrf2 family iron-sulfur cluster assembly transcriptional regulator